jgi:heat shock protein HtpX
MQYVGLHTQQARNNFRSVLLLCLFPCLVILLIFLFSVLLTLFTSEDHGRMGVMEQSALSVQNFAPFILGGVAIWFVIAYFANTAIIRSATGARSLERKENKRIYNLVENLCMAQGMPMPKIDLIEDNAMNAFASGINNHTYTVSLSRGLINRLDDEELEAVIAHELSHIRNRDVRLLIISIVFVGLFAVLTQVALRVLRFMPIRSRSSNNKSGAGIAVILLITLIVAAIGYLFATLMRFAISRKREYMADAAAAEMTRRPYALANALRKIAQNPDIQAVTRDDVAQLFIEHPRKKGANKLFAGISELFATHPPIEKRIAVLEGF